MNKELLKELIKEELFNNTSCYSKSHFHFDFNPNSRDYITYTDVSIVVTGNSCWEDSKEEIIFTNANNFNEYQIGEIINQLIIPEDEIKKLYNMDYIIDEYYNKKIDSYHSFISEDLEDTEQDAYGNKETIRTLIININEIAEYLLSFKFLKSDENIKVSFLTLSKNDINEIENRPLIRQFILNDKLNINQNLIKRNKI